MSNDIINEVLVPVTNINRRLPNGESYSDELVNKSQSWVTSAGYRGTEAYYRLIDIVFNSIIHPDQYFVTGGSYHIPVAEGLLDENFVEKLQLESTFNEVSFGREFLSEWGGTIDNAFFSPDTFDRNRILKQPEEKYMFPKKKMLNCFYVLGIDVGRSGCNTEIAVIKVFPKEGNQYWIKQLVNVYSMEAEDFEIQACKIKAICEKFNAKICVIDSNGLGIGLIDFMTKMQTDPDTNQSYMPYGIENTDMYPLYKQYNKLPNIKKNMIYMMKANAPINTEGYAYLQSSLSSGQLKLLIDEKTAMVNLQSTRVGRNMKPEQRAAFLMPFTQTTILREQLLNLCEDHEGINLILKQNNKKIPKDKVSALMYGMYWIRQYEEKNKGKRERNIADFMFFGH